MNVSFNEVSQLSHVGWGYLLTTFPVLLFHVYLPYMAIATVVGAGIKEYADVHGLETLEVAGSSWEDFGFWCVGIALGVLAIR